MFGVLQCGQFSWLGLLGKTKAGMLGMLREEEGGQSQKSITLGREEPRGGGRTPAEGAAAIQAVAAHCGQ